MREQIDYVGNMIYENNALKRILVDGGYVEDGNYYFYETDHLGNNRVVMNDVDLLVQTNDYYPYGMSFAEGLERSKQPYKYNGKEFDAERGLNLYDYSARFMDPALGRFTTADPLAEKYYSVSPYAYCAGNPINAIDPDGKDYKVIVDDKKKTITISATYYVLENAFESAQNASKILNEHSGKYIYDVSEGEKNAEYTINFDLKVEKVEKKFPDADDSSNLNYKLGDNSGEANVYLLTDKLSDNVNGSTSGGNAILVKKTRKDESTGAHEMGHTLGLLHSSSGLMTAAAQDKERNSKLTKSNIKTIILHSFKTKRKGARGKGSIDKTNLSRKGKIKKL